jgi:hypothetical protein
MRVFRIEAIEGGGLYAADVGYEFSLAGGLSEYFPFEGARCQPLPSEDGLTRGDEAFGKLYGFTGVPQMLSWLNGCPIDLLYERGGRIIKLDVKDAECGYNQCRFEPDAIISRKVLKLHDFKEEFNNGPLHWRTN